MRKAVFIFVAVCIAFVLLGFGVFFLVSVADPAAAGYITVRFSASSGSQSNDVVQAVVSLVDGELLRRGFSRDPQTHDLDDTNWVTVYSYAAKHYPPKTDVLSSGCNVHEGAHEIRIELWELGVLRPTQQFAKIRQELREALVKKCREETVN